MAAKVDETQNVLYIELGKKIKNVRNKKKLSQADLAKACSLSRTSITNIEKGRQHLPLHTLYTIAYALGINVAELLPDQYLSFDKLVLEDAQEELPQNARDWLHEEINKIK